MLLLGFLALCGIGALIGAVLLYPTGSGPKPTAEYAQPGVTFPNGTVEKVLTKCPGGSAQCAVLVVRMDSGPDKGTLQQIQVSSQVAQAGAGRGDTVQLVRVPGGAGAPATYNFFGVDRHGSILVLALLFVLVVGLVARWRGLLAVLGLGISALVVFKFMLPALLRGQSGVAVALVGSAVIMFVVLYLAHGPSLRTSTALAGTIVGIMVTLGLGTWAVAQAHLTGVGDETAGMLSAEVNLDFHGLFLCGLVLATLGVLNDVTITQASAVWELRAAAPDRSPRTLFTRAMRIGRDHIASTIYTIVFAYTGAALALMLLVELYDRPLLSLLNSEDLADEVMRILAAAIGLILAVPITTAIAVAVVGHSRVEDV